MSTCQGTLKKEYSGGEELDLALLLGEIIGSGGKLNLLHWTEDKLRAREPANVR